jgi:peptidyl-tRNA hydrolase, PTH1 family
VADELWLVVGLGNPGEQYAATRHNAGAMAVDELAGRIGGRFRAGKGRWVAADGRLAGERVALIKPTSYMNESGGPVAGAAKYFSVEPERIVVVHDELDIDFGSVKLKRGGGPGGHNGLRDIDKALGTRDYYRVRVGIGRPPGRQDPADFVLKPFSAAERKELPFLLSDAADAVEQLLGKGLDAAQQTFHSKD